MPINVPVEERCSFCAYLHGDRPYTVLERSDQVALLVTREQRGIGHVLVLPEAHRPTVLDLDPSEHGPLMSSVQRVARALVATFDVDGVAVWQNNGRSSHQTIPHLHVHVAGTREGRPTDWGPVPTLELDETETLAERIRPNLA